MKITGLKVAGKARIAHQVGDAQTHIDFPTQIEQARGHAVEPQDFVVVVEYHHAIGHGRRGMAQLAKHIEQSLLVIALAAVQTHNVCDHFTPQSAQVRRRAPIARPQPTIQTVEIDQLPA